MTAVSPTSPVDSRKLEQAWLQRQRKIELAVRAGLIVGSVTAIDYDVYLPALMARIIHCWPLLSDDDTYHACLHLVEKMDDVAVKLLGYDDLLAAYTIAGDADRAEQVADLAAACRQHYGIVFTDPPDAPAESVLERTQTTPDRRVGGGRT